MTTHTNLTVEATSSKEVKTRFGMKPTFSFLAEGNWYKTGFKNPHLNKGDVVSFESKDSSYGPEVVEGTLTRAAATAAAPSPAAPRPAPSGGKGVFPIPPLDGQRAIVRQNALTNARELLIGMVAHDTHVDKLTEPGAAKSWKDRQKQMDALADEVIRIARKFEAYACGDLDMEAAMKPSSEAPKE